MFGWHLHVRSRPFSLVCFVCSVCTFLSEAVRFLCFVCSVGTFLSEAVRFLGVVLCVRLAPSGQKPSKARFLGFFCAFGWHLPVRSRPFSRFVCCVRLVPSGQKASIFSGLFCVFGWHLPAPPKPILWKITYSAQAHFVFSYNHVALQPPQINGF